MKTFQSNWLICIKIKLNESVYNLAVQVWKCTYMKRSLEHYKISAIFVQLFSEAKDLINSKPFVQKLYLHYANILSFSILQVTIGQLQLNLSTANQQIVSTMASAFL